MLEQFQDIIRSAAIKWNVPELWLKGFIMTESSGNPRAYRYEAKLNDASYGLMQLLYSTAKGLGYSGSPEGLYDPTINVDLGAKLISQLRQKYGDDLRAVYSAYNSGNGTNYLTNSTVAAHVNNAVEWVEKFIREEPLVVGSGAVGGLLVLLLLWYWTQRKGK